jgi:hypothetical protein
MCSLEIVLTATDKLVKLVFERISDSDVPKRVSTYLKDANRRGLRYRVN